MIERVDWFRCVDLGTPLTNLVKQETQKVLRIIPLVLFLVEVLLS